MANTSIFNAFERMWQHTNTVLDQKQEEIPNLYVWKKYDGDPLYSKTNVTDAIISVAAIGTNCTIDYASEIEIVDETISLINSARINVEDYNDTQLDLIKGKYVKYVSTIYFIPDNATFLHYSGSINVWGIKVSRATKITINDGTSGSIGYVASKSFSTYPSDGEHTDGYWYKYIKQLGDAAVVDDSSVSFTETDPTVPAWAKEANKPTYTASEVGAQESDLVVTFTGSWGALVADKTFDEVVVAYKAGRRVYAMCNALVYDLYMFYEDEVIGFIRRVTSSTSYTTIDLYYNGSVEDTTGELDIYHPVASVNGKTGAVVLTASDVGALPDTTVIPTKTSDLTNDSGYITEAPVISINGKTGVIQLTAADVGALSSDTLNSAIDTALAEAKASGEFDGSDYVLTDADKQEIAEMVEVTEGGTVTDEQIASAVEEYMAEHPIEVPDSSPNVYIGPDEPTGDNRPLYWLDTSGDSTGEDTTVYTVIANLTNVTIDNTVESMNEGESYAATITAVDGYVLAAVSVTMGGVDITGTNYADGNIFIASVTGNIVITATAVEASVTTYTITNSLVNVTSDNSAVSVEENSAYSATLTADEGYVLESATVTMGGTDVTADVYADGVVNITAVTGDVVISAVAVAESEAELLTNVVATGVTFAWNPDYNQYILAAKEGVNLYEYQVESGKTYALYISGLGQYTNPYVTSSNFTSCTSENLFAVGVNKATDFTVGTHGNYTWNTDTVVESVTSVIEDDGTYTKYRKFTPAIDGYMYVDDRCGFGLSVKEVTE